MKYLSAHLRRLFGPRETRGNAILEFAFVFPVLLALIGGVADFGLYIWTRARLLDAISYGAQYAFLVGTATGANGNIQSAVQKVANSSFSGTTVTVTGPACYCISGSNPATMATQSCAVKCGGVALPGTYVIIQASYTYSPIFPVLSTYLNTTMYENITLRVK